MKCKANFKLAITYLRDGRVRYQADGLSHIDHIDAKHWRPLAQLMAEKMGRYVTEDFAWVMFTEAMQSNRIKTNNGVWSGRLTDKPVVEAIMALLAEPKWQRNTKRYFKNTPVVVPAHMRNDDMEWTISQLSDDQIEHLRKRRCA